MEAKGTPLFKNFVRAYEELATLLSRKEFIMHKLPGQEVGQIWGAVKADESDMKALTRVDPEFLSRHQASLKGHGTNGGESGDSKPAALENRQSPALNGGSDPTVEFNPWAQGSTVGATTQTIDTAGEPNPAADMDDIYT